MSTSHTQQVQYTIGNTVVTGRQTITSGSGLKISEAVPTPSTALQIACDVDVSQMVSCFLMCDQAVTVQTNSSGSPDETFALAANVPYMWSTDAPFTNKFATDLANLYITNSSGTAATLDAIFLTDPTV